MSSNGVKGGVKNKLGIIPALTSRRAHAERYLIRREILKNLKRIL
jgi:hypothetical protein